MSKQITGRATLYIDGAVIPAENGAKLNPGGVNRKAERHGGTTYYAEEEVMPTLECTVQHTAQVDIQQLSAIKDATVMFEADTGQKWALRGAFTTEPVDLDAGTGKSSLKMAAQSCDRV